MSKHIDLDDLERRVKALSRRVAKLEGSTTQPAIGQPRTKLKHARQEQLRKAHQRIDQKFSTTKNKAA